ncbi:hypothetical protein DV735_g5956, partial [Chaetothyriales sp. CBS 134920]
MAYPPSSYHGNRNRGPARSLSRSITVPHRQLSVVEQAGLDQSDADAGILYTHPGVRIFSFEPPPETINSKSTETHPDADYPIDTVGMLPWRSNTEILVGSGALYIEKVRGSVPCFKCGGDFVQPIVRNSQCWCVDGESKFVLRRGKLQYYRFELPTSTPEEQKKVEELKTVLANVLKFETTPCPFKRAFHVELPDDAIIPRRKGKWRRREASLPLTLDQPARPLRRSEPARVWRARSDNPAPSAETPAARRGSDYGYVQTPRHASLRTSYLADRPETPSSMASSEELERRRMEDDSEDDSSEAYEEEHRTTFDAPPPPILLAKRNPDADDLAAIPGETDSGTEEPELPGIAPQPTPPDTVINDSSCEPEPELPRIAPQPTPPDTVINDSSCEPEPELPRIAPQPTPPDTVINDSSCEPEPELPRIAPQPTPPDTVINDSSCEPEPEIETHSRQDLEQDIHIQDEPEHDSDMQRDPEQETDTRQEQETDARQERETLIQQDLEEKIHTRQDPEQDPEEETQGRQEPDDPFIDEAVVLPEDYKQFEPADIHDHGRVLPLVEEELASVEELPGLAIDDGESDDVSINLADLPEGTFLPSTPELHYLEEHADLLEEHGFSDEELPPWVLAARPIGAREQRTVPASSPPPMKSFDTESVASTAASFHTADSDGVGSDNEGSPSRHGMNSHQHKRDLSEITVTASSWSSSLRPQSTSIEDWPAPSLSGDIQEGIRRRVQSRKALSPPPRPSGIGASSENQVSGLVSTIVYKVCRLAVVKPIEVFVLVANVVVRIAGGATVNDLISGELFRLPSQAKRSTNFLDQVSRPKYATEDEPGENDDFGVPIRGRTANIGSEDESEPELQQQRTAAPPKSSAPAQPKSILKKPRSRVSQSPSPSGSHSHSSSDLSDLAAPDSRASSPGLVLDPNSRAFKDRQAEEDAEILALEKKLGLKKGKKPKLFAEDGSELDKASASEDDDEEMSDSEDASFDGFGKVRENPYVPPVSANSTGKYVPPSLRKTQSTEGQNHDRLHRQMQGHLNKLSEANLVSILNEIEKIYQSNPRQEVTSVLINLLLSLFSDRSTLQNTFVILHAAFITAVYRVMGTDFGAELLSRLVERFKEHHATPEGGKAGLNLMSLLATLFSFNMIGSGIVYEYIYQFLSSLTETNTELLLRIIRDCGLQLRSDDPVALKAAVSKTQTNARAYETSGQAMSVRTKFLIETIVDLKNNKMRESTANSAVTKEHITRMRKVLGGLNSRPLRATEPLRLSLSDLENSEKKGKWWLVGASWKGHGLSEDESKSDHGQARSETGNQHDSAVTARDYGLTTPLQQLIFAAISGAETYVEAHVRVTKLRLKRAQEPEIARVILRLCGSEQQYNPFYAHLAKHLCAVEGGKRMKKTFDFALWAFFRRLGENGNEEDEDEETAEGDVAVEEINNIAHLYADLIHWRVTDLAVLKVLELQYLKEHGLLLVEMMLVRLLLLCKDDHDVQAVFAAAPSQGAPMLKLFLKDHVKTSDLAGDSEKKTRLLRQRSRLASKSLDNDAVV